jgi:Mg2+/Co2+ transporter CorB
VPRNEILAVEQGKNIEEIKATLIETKLSRIIVYDKDIDNIIGYIHHLDLFKNPKTIKEVLHPIIAVPETMSATELMNQFSKTSAKNEVAQGKADNKVNKIVSDAVETITTLKEENKLLKQELNDVKSKLADMVNVDSAPGFNLRPISDSEKNR